MDVVGLALLVVVHVIGVVDGLHEGVVGLGMLVGPAVDRGVEPVVDDVLESGPSSRKRAMAAGIGLDVCRGPAEDAIVDEEALGVRVTAAALGRGAGRGTQTKASPGRAMKSRRT